MKQLLKKILLTILPPYIAKLVLSLPEGFRKRRILFAHYLGRIKDISTNYSYQVISIPNQHCFFGYYDISPFSLDCKKILNIGIDGISNKVDIHLFDIETKENPIIAEGNVWNWQQGCRLRWHPQNENYIIFNCINEGKYCSQIYNVKNNKPEAFIPIPIYDVDGAGKFGISLNFSRLGIMRPGYGYTTLPYDNYDEDLANEGIDIVNLENLEIKRLIRYKDLVNLLETNDNDLSHYYLNHLSFSPSGEKFLFFFINGSTKRHDAYMLVYDITSSMVIPLEMHDKVSHYTWLSEDDILATVYDDNNHCRYYQYNVSKKNRVLFNSVNRDGHPSRYKEGFVLTDTYPDRSRSVQNLLFTNKNDSSICIAEIFSTPEYGGEQRTDLHPRFNQEQTKVCVDMNRKGFREMCIFDIK